MDHTQIQGSDAPQMVTINGQQLQVLQMNNHVIQGPNGQQIVVHAIPTASPTIQVATPSGQQLQQIQVLPVSNLQNPSGNVPFQLLQTPDGQAFLYQPTAGTPQHTIDQHQILHQPAVINLNGNLVQVAGVNSGIQSQQVVNQPNIVMMVNGNNSGATSAPSASSSSGEQATNTASDEEPLLYVNARQYKRILKRRIARARLHELGKIPKERPKYLHESRHKHAMNRIRGEGGRFHSGSRKKMLQQMQQQAQVETKVEADKSSSLEYEDIKPMAITIIQDVEHEPIACAPSQWRRLPQQQSLPST